MGGDARVSLDALEAATLADARERAREIREATEERARRLLADAHAEARTLLAEQHASAERRAELAERRRIAQARADAHALVLHAQRAVLAEARQAAYAAAQALREDPRYAQLSERLAARARARLASAGPVRIVAAPDGGLLARAGSLQIDNSLSAQVERCLQGLASELRRLWL